jgi:hypothetical protein
VSRNHTVRERIAGQSAMAAVVEAQSNRVRQGRLAHIFGVSPLTPQGKIDHRDAVGELFVGSILDHLGQNWDVLHGLPLGELSLDHFAVGRPGVFAFVVVNCRGGEVAINGDELIVGRTVKGCIVDAKKSAMIVADTLSAATEAPVAVTAVLVLVRPSRVAILRQPDNVHVANSRQLEQWLLSRTPLISGDDVAQISRAAEADRTWPEPHTTARRARNLARIFTAIQRDVRAASLRRFCWVSALGLAMIVAVAKLVSVLTSMS